MSKRPNSVAAPAEDKTSPRHFRPRRELALTWLGIVVTVVAGVLTSHDVGEILSARAATGAWLELAGYTLFLLMVLTLIYGGLLYQVTRIGYIERKAEHRPASPADLAPLFDAAAPPVTVLVPSYREEESVVRMTLLSAALQEYPGLRVVLLIDDPPQAKSPAEALQLTRMRSLPERIQARLAKPAVRLAGALAAFDARRSAGGLDLANEAARLSALHVETARWFEEELASTATDHVASLFALKVLRRQRNALLERAHALRLASEGASGTEPLNPDALANAYRRLLALFDAELTSFERKCYDNLSHEPNKAMNLNSYLSLIGRSLRIVEQDGARIIEEVPREMTSLGIPDARYVVTLDADSILLPDYVPRLVHFMEQPENARVAVVQTPYSAFPDAPGLLERIAGVTTDIQYLIHQGFTAYNGTYWVGANALLRRAALDDIVEVYRERGHTVRRYIQDRTVIEDTESTVDLVFMGWRLHNYPERLSYSATPADFGSLLIQRRRWANGGLIILGKLLRYLRKRDAHRAGIAEAFVRIHYLVSIAVVNVSLLVLLAVPFTEGINSPWLPLTALPYFALYLRDLVQMGYRATDLVRVYALNLLLIPVNLGGVAKSLHQAATGAKIPFGRTPKISGRTAAPRLYVLAEGMLVLQWMIAGGLDLLGERWVHGGFALANAMLLLYAVVAFIGLREGWADLTQRRRVRGDADPAMALPFGVPIGAFPEPQPRRRETPARTAVPYGAG